MAKYTEEQIIHISNEYKELPTRETVDRLAQELEVSPRSIIGKLVALKIYKTPPKLNKRGQPVELKRDLVKEIGDFFGLEIPSLEKAEREELRTLRDAIKNPDNLRAILVDLEDELNNDLDVEILPEKLKKNLNLCDIEPEDNYLP